MIEQAEIKLLDASVIAHESCSKVTAQAQAVFPTPSGGLWHSCSSRKGAEVAEVSEAELFDAFLSNERALYPSLYPSDGAQTLLKRSP